MKTIPLTRGMFTVVDDCDYARLNRWKWYAAKRKRKNGKVVWYAVRTTSRKRPPVKMLLMHREIRAVVGIPNVDHRDGDGLNNRRSNIRPATHSQNLQNSRKRIGCSSQFKGVSLFKRNGKWRAYIDKDKHRKYLGHFKVEKDAADAYNRAAFKMFGEFALLNEFSEKQNKKGKK